MNSFCAWYSLRMSFCSVPPSARALDAVRLRVGDVHREDHRGRPVDRHRRRDRAEVDARGRGPRRRRACRRRRRTCRPRRARARRRSRGPSASAGRTRSTGRRRRRRAARGSAGSCRSRCRSRRTSASSTSFDRYIDAYGPACTGTGPGTRRRRVRRPARPGRPTSSRSRPRDGMRRERLPRSRLLVTPPDRLPRACYRARTARSRRGRGRPCSRRRPRSPGR